MAITNAQRKLWSSSLKIEAVEASVLPFISNQAYQMDAIGASSIDVIGVATPAITDYVKADDLTYPDLVDNKKTININQAKKFTFKVNTIDQAQSGVNYVDPTIVAAGQALGLSADTYGFGSTTYANTGIPAASKLGSLATPIGLTVTNVEEYLDGLATQLRVNHVMGGGYCVLPPAVMSLIRRAGITTLTQNADLFAERVVGKYAGLTLIESTEVAVDDTADGFQVLAFSPRAIAYVYNVQEIESLMNPVNFGEVVRGLYAFGTEVIFPTELAVLSCTV